MSDYVFPASLLAFFIWVAIMLWVDWYVSREYYIEQAKMYTECVHQWMVLDGWDCIPYKKNK